MECRCHVDSQIQVRNWSTCLKCHVRSRACVWVKHVRRDLHQKHNGYMRLRGAISGSLSCLGSMIKRTSCVFTGSRSDEDLLGVCLCLIGSHCLEHPSCLNWWYGLNKENPRKCSFGIRAMGVCVVGCLRAVKDGLSILIC